MATSRQRWGQWWLPSWRVAQRMGVSHLKSFYQPISNHHNNSGATLGWTGLIRVDGLPYTWMGAPMEAANGTAPVVNQVSFSYTSTKSIFTMHVNNQVSMTITFLSAIFPEDFKRQSFPYSYMNVDVASLDGKAHAVQLYSDISAGKS